MIVRPTPVVVLVGDPALPSPARASLARVARLVRASADAADAARTIRDSAAVAALVEVGGEAAGDLDLVAALHRLVPTVAILMSTSESDHELALLGLWHGAAGIVPSSATPDAMRRLLDATIRGEAVASRRLVLRLIEQLRASGAYHVAPAGRPLSPREREVLDLLERGCTTAEIAGGLGVAQGTVRTHVKHIRDKLGPEPLPA